LVASLNTEESVSELLQILPTADRDANHQRGTFVGAVRTLNIALGDTPGIATRIAIGDGKQDPKLEGTDALTGDKLLLAGNYGVTYKINLTGAAGLLGAISPRGGMYAGAISVNGRLYAVPESGLLYRPNSPFLLFRDLRTDLVQLELVPASGSALPINIVLYRPEAK
jgi:hypothetical protein